MVRTRILWTFVSVNKCTAAKVGFRLWCDSATAFHSANIRLCGVRLFIFLTFRACLLLSGSALAFIPQVAVYTQFLFSYVVLMERPRTV